MELLELLLRSSKNVSYIFVCMTKEVTLHDEPIPVAMRIVLIGECPSHEFGTKGASCLLQLNSANKGQ